MVNRPHNGRLHLLEPRDGTVAATITVAEGGPTLLLEGSTVLRVDASGRVVERTGKGLEPGAVWRTDEPVAFGVASGRTAILVGRSGGFFRIRIR